MTHLKNLKSIFIHQSPLKHDRMHKYAHNGNRILTFLYFVLKFSNVLEFFHIFSIYARKKNGKVFQFYFVVVVSEEFIILQNEL